MGPDFKITSVAASDLHTEVLPQETQEAFSASQEFNFLQPDWYLAGGTALALQVGHRSSEDLDFFTEQKEFDIELLERNLERMGSWETTMTDRGTLWGVFKGVKMSFIAYPFFRSSPTRMQCGVVQILIPDDIMAMKIIAISQRGKKRDFVDMYWYCTQGGSLSDTIHRTLLQFPDKEHNIPHYIKSLVYFDDAEEDPMPTLHFKADWKTIKQYFQREVPNVAKKFLALP